MSKSLRDDIENTMHSLAFHEESIWFYRFNRMGVKYETKYIF